MVESSALVVTVIASSPSPVAAPPASVEFVRLLTMMVSFPAPPLIELPLMTEPKVNSSLPPMPWSKRASLVVVAGSANVSFPGVRVSSSEKVMQGLGQAH